MATRQRPNRLRSYLFLPNFVDVHEFALSDGPGAGSFAVRGLALNDRRDTQLEFPDSFDSALLLHAFFVIL